MNVHLFRYVGPALLVAALMLVINPSDAGAQDPQDVEKPEVFQTAHVMELSNRLDPDTGEMACLGNPDTLRVKVEDIVVFRAVGTHVNDIRWDDPKNPNNNLAKGNRKNTDGFQQGKAFVIRINKRANKRHEGYKLKVSCGDLDDAPPVIIVD